MKPGRVLAVLAALAGLPLAAPAQTQRGMNLSVASIPPTNAFPLGARPSRSATGYQPAPLPNRDMAQPGPEPEAGSSLTPTLFTRKDTYRGEALTRGSSAQSEQEKRFRPGAGFSLKVPLTPN